MAIDDLSVSLDLVAAREYFCRLWNALDPDTKRLIIKAKVIACLDDELGEYMQLEANFYMRLCEEYSRMMVEEGLAINAGIDACMSFEQSFKDACQSDPVMMGNARRWRDVKSSGK